MRRSFAFRLAAAFAGVGIAAAALTAILVNLAFGARFESYLKDQRASQQEQLAAALADSYVRMGGWDETDLEALTSVALMGCGTLRILDQGGAEVWRASVDDSGPMAEMHRQMMGCTPLGRESPFPIQADGVRVGTAAVRLPAPGLLPEDASFRASVNGLLLLGGVGAGLAALGLGVVLARRAIAPARELTRAAHALSAGDRARRVTFEGPDELGEMASAFNRMADTIEEEDRLRKVFAADVAHELRTPLSILRTQVEGLQDGVVEVSPRALESLHEETLRLTRLVGDLETLASAEAAGFSLERRQLALRPLLEECVREFAGSFAEHEVELISDLDDVVTSADPTRVRQVVSNLLSNALKFTPAGGTCRVELRAEDDEAVIRVSDSGPGIPTDELPHVFDRFFRGRGARAGGSGIGLTVALELVRAHGGDMDVSSTPGGGTTFVVRLPVASSAGRASFTGPSHPPAMVGAEGGEDR